MIQVTRLNGMPMIVNSDLIKLAESSPDTMLTLIPGEKLIVRESCEEIVDRIIAYRARLLAAVAAKAHAASDAGRGPEIDLMRLAATGHLPVLVTSHPDHPDHKDTSSGHRA